MKMSELPKYVVYSLPPSAIESVVNEFEKGNFPYVVLDSTLQGKRKGNNNLVEYTINFIKHDQLRELKDQLTENSNDIFLILDEFHLMLNMNTQRTSIALELSKICNNFIAMTGTLIKDSDPTGIIEWTSQVVDFLLTPDNYLVGVATLISKKINYGIEEKRKFVDIEMNVPEYYDCVTSNLGGNAKETNFRQAVNICYDVIQEEIFNTGMNILKSEAPIFIVALNTKMQTWLANKFKDIYKCFIINSNNSINLTTPGDIQVVITTMSHSTGYNLTACKTMITSVYFSNQATRTQMEGRIIRMGQISPYVDIIILHTGILSYILDKYEEARSIEKALKALATEI